MSPHVFPASRLLFLTLFVAEGAKQYSIEPNGQLSLSSTWTDEAGGRQNASQPSDRGMMMRKDSGGMVHAKDARGGDDSLVQETPAAKGLLRCGWTTFAPDDPCPAECPLLAEESWNPCHFQCVSTDSCGLLDPKATVADLAQKRCRPCAVAGCDTCVSGGKDKCHKCSMGYILDDKGECYSGGWYVWAIFKVIAVVIFTFIALWLLELGCRRASNLKGLKHGMGFRKRTRCHMPLDTPAGLGVVDPADSSGMIYPMTTNLLVTPVGGVGTSLFFSFQAFVLFWAAVLCASWAYWASRYGYDLVKLGTLPAHTPQQLCAVVRWGAKRQQEMFADKFYFTIWAYIFSFFSCIAFAVYQQIRFNQMDDLTTLKDYACYVRGLPSKGGDENVESLWKEFLEKETGQKIVGVSVAWNMMKGGQDYEQAQTALEAEAVGLETAHTLLKNGGQEPREDDDEIHIPDGGLTKGFKAVDKVIIKGMLGIGEKPPEADAEQIREMLVRMKTSDVCFAVFESEQSRDDAVALSKQNRGFMWDKNIVRLETKACEPRTVLWYGLSLGSRTGQRNRKMVQGGLFILLCLILWTCLFYLPYAYYVTAFTYANGNEPPVFASMIFTLLVVGGNQVMYFVADAVSTWADFGFEDERQFWYNVYYLVACLLNVAADITLSGYLAYRQMVGMGVHTADGKLLESVTSIHDIIESYPMQKTMGSMLFAYCYPSTFLVPFLIEPIGTILAPHWLGKSILRSHREYQDRDAEIAMQFFVPMDLSRYSDLLLNMNLAVLVLYLPGGYVLPMFFAMVLSHIYILCYDHWRVLRAVPNFCYSRNTCDQFGSSWMALPCALILSCAVFKGYHIFWPELNGASLVCVMLWAFVGHLFWHTTIIRMIYKIKAGKTKKAEQTFAEAAKFHPDTWFSTNPIHCLRSKYIWNHEPAQVYHITGKEHLQRENAKIGAFFEDKTAQKLEPPKEVKAGKAAPKAKPRT